MTNTQWHRTEVSTETSRFLRGTHTLWSRIMDGEHIFTVRPNGEVPNYGDGGYFSIASALKVKGMDLRFSNQ
jgi:hypothetical protein